MQVFVLGAAGQMGQAVCYAMKKLGHDIIAVDKVVVESYTYLYVDIENRKHLLYHWLDQYKPNLVISCLPYYHNEQVAEICFQYDPPINYCDLGGDIKTSFAINQMIKLYNMKHSITDLGLAPGLVNILTENLYNEVSKTEKIDSVKMYCGGLPKSPIKYGPLKYGISWSADGLINEYKGKCRILDHGSVEYVDGMSGPENIDWFKARHTSGGSSYTIDTMYKRGVKTCYYKTLRLGQHWELAEFLIRQCNLDNQALKKIFERYKLTEDIVHVIIRVNETKKNMYIQCDKQFTAMQKATGFSLAAVADLLNPHHSDVITDYACVPIDKFKSNMNKLGINL